MTTPTKTTSQPALMVKVDEAVRDAKARLQSWYADPDLYHGARTILDSEINAIIRDTRFGVSPISGNCSAYHLDGAGSLPRSVLTGSSYSWCNGRSQLIKKPIPRTTATFAKEVLLRFRIALLDRDSPALTTLINHSGGSIYSAVFLGTWFAGRLWKSYGENFGSIIPEFKEHKDKWERLCLFPELNKLGLICVEAGVPRHNNELQTEDKMWIVTIGTNNYTEVLGIKDWEKHHIYS